MKKVKKVYFLEKEELDKLKKEDNYISDYCFTQPVFELENGTIMYPKHGYPDNGSIWYEPI